MKETPVYRASKLCMLSWIVGLVTVILLAYPSRITITLGMLMFFAYLGWHMFKFEW